MGDEREILMETYWERLYETEGVVRVGRNPESPPKPEDMPCINFFEGNDVITKNSRRNDGTEIRQRRLSTRVEAIIQGTSDTAASKELLAFVAAMKSKLFSGTNLFNRLCGVEEGTSYPIIVIPGGDHVRGMGIDFDLLYIEKI